QPLGGDQPVADTDELRNLVPLDVMQIETHADPPPRAEVLGHEKSLRVERDERVQVSSRDFAAQSNSPVAGMVVQEGAESSVPHVELDVLVAAGLCLGKGEADVHEPGSGIGSSGWPSAH